MWTLMADSLLTGLPSLVKPTGSFFRDQSLHCILLYQQQTSFLPCSYLSTFQFMSPFISRYCFQLSSCPTPGLSWKMHVDFWQLAGGFFPTNMSRFYDRPMKLSLKLPCIPLNILGNIKDHALEGGGGRVQLGATAIQALSLLFPSSSGVLFLRHAAEGG